MRAKAFVPALQIALVLAACAPMAVSPQTELASTSTVIPAPFTETIEPTASATASPGPVSTELPPDLNISIEKSMLSPSGQWLALVLIATSDNGRKVQSSSMLVVVNQQDSAEQTVEKLDFPSGFAYAIPWALAWSADEASVYYTHRFLGGDGCFGEDDVFGTDLYRFDLESRESTELAPKLGYWLALSPDHSRLAYLTNDDEIRIQDVETGETRGALIHEQQKYSEPVLTHASHLLWSPDQKELLLTFQVNVCVMEDDAKNSIIKINAETLSQTVLVFEDVSRPETVEWTDENRVLVQDENGVSWWLNPVNGQMTERP